VAVVEQDAPRDEARSAGCISGADRKIDRLQPQHATRATARS